MYNDHSDIKLPNGWECVNIIGQGSFGIVYRAKRTTGQYTEWAAVKHISMPSNLGELDAICAELGTRDSSSVRAYISANIQGLLDEYYVMKTMQKCTNIVDCYDIQQIPKADGLGYDVYIWMELLESLSNRIIEKKVDCSETIRMGMDICQALCILRSKRIIHRDIKPQNIFVDKQGNYKLGDFGTARGIQGTSTIMSMKGTYFYLAPEIIQGRSAGYTSDIYSLGLVMHRLMNRNRHPFMQENEVSSARSVEQSNFRRLNGERLPMPVDADKVLGQIILKACEYNPSDRWQTPEEMYSALANLEGKRFASNKPECWQTPGEMFHTLAIPQETKNYSKIPVPVNTQEGNNTPGTPAYEPKDNGKITKRISRIPANPGEGNNRKMKASKGCRNKLVWLILAALVVAAMGYTAVSIINRKTNEPRIPRATSVLVSAGDSKPTATPNTTNPPKLTAPPTLKPVNPSRPTAAPSPKPTSRLQGYTAIGSTFTFGHYEQDGKTSNGKEEILWEVLDYDKSHNRILVLSVYGLHTMKYHKNNNQTAWGDTSVRKWLNGTFLKSFSSDEKAMIDKTNISKSSDYCFLLDAAQIKKYLSSPYYCYATKQAKSEGAYINTKYGSSSWLVRSDVTENRIAWVGGAGELYTPKGKTGVNYMTSKDNVVRPAMWLEISP